MERYICPDCGTEMQKRTVIVIDGTAVHLECPKCFLGIRKSRYDAILNYGKNETETTVDREKIEISDKPPLGCPPHYVGISARIQELCGAIERNAAKKDMHNRIRLWLKEIWLLNEVDRDLRYEEKSRVWKENADGKLQEMP